MIRATEQLNCSTTSAFRAGWRSFHGVPFSTHRIKRRKIKCRSAAGCQAVIKMLPVKNNQKTGLAYGIFILLEVSVLNAGNAS
jgi:hypothetical protein